MRAARSITSAIAALAALVLTSTPATAHSASGAKAYPPSASIRSGVDMAAWPDNDLANGRSRFMFSGWTGPAIPVWAYVPEGIDRQTAPIMFLLHGAKRDPRRYLEEWTDFADADGFIIVAPEFAKVNFKTSRQYNMGNIFRKRSTTMRPESDWSYSAIEPLFDHAVAKLGGQQEEYTLYGHSAGSQFVHRFLFTVPKARAKRIMAANAGWYTMPTAGFNYPYGLGNLNLTVNDVKAALAKDVVILLGDRDNDANHESLRRTPEAMQQGPHRFARGKSFYAMGKQLADEMETQFGWSLRVIPGVAHSNGGIAKGAHELVE